MTNKRDAETQSSLHALILRFNLWCNI